jgi:MFS family permease
VAADRLVHPLRNATFRALWIANIVSNIGTWMQTVGGAWLMTNLTADAFPVALMQTATTLPGFLVGLPAGSLADRVDRRQLLIATQLWMLVCAVLLGLVTLLGGATVWLLLVLTFAIGLGNALSAPAWSAIVPDIVTRQQLPAAISANSGGYNVSRAIGPAAGGFVVAAAGAGYAFFFNAASFLATLGVVARWRPHAEAAHRPASEPFISTILGGLRYVWQAEPQRIVVVRSMLWMLCASALWALLPIVARRELGLDATGYGFLVTCAGVGAIGGAIALPSLRSRYPTNFLLMCAIVTFALMYLVLAWITFLPLIYAMLAIGGVAWTTSNQNFQIAVQLSAPRRMAARAIAAYLLSFQGGQAIGAALWGAASDRLGDPITLTLAAFLTVVGILAAFRWVVADEPLHQS